MLRQNQAEIIYEENTLIKLRVNFNIIFLAEIDKVDRIFGEPIRYYKMNDDDRHLKKILEQKQQKRIQKEIDLHNNIVKHYNFEVDDLEQEMHFETKRVNRVKPSRIIIKYPEA